MRAHRLVGWWLAAVLMGSSVPAFGQSTAAFPSDTAAPPPPKPAPPPPAPRPPTTAPRARPTSPKPAPRPAVPPKQKAQPRPAPAPAAQQPAATAKPKAPVVQPAPSWSPPPRAPQTAAGSSGDSRPPVLPYYDGLPVPPGYEVRSRPATGIITGGLVGLGVSYGAGLGVAASQGFKNASGWLVLPIAGPWLAVAERDYEQCKTTTVQLARRCVSKAVAEVQFITFVAVDGVFQLGSGLLLLAGALSTKQELMRSDLVPEKDRRPTVSFSPPLPGRSAWQLSVQGQF